MKSKILEAIKTYLIVTLGGLIVTCGVHFFSFPNNFSTGGTSSLSGTSLFSQAILPYSSPRDVSTIA